MIDFVSDIYIYISNVNNISVFFYEILWGGGGGGGDNELSLRFIILLTHGLFCVLQ